MEIECKLIKICFKLFFRVRKKSRKCVKVLGTSGKRKAVYLRSECFVCSEHHNYYNKYKKRIHQVVILSMPVFLCNHNSVHSVKSSVLLIEFIKSMKWLGQSGRNLEPNFVLQTSSQDIKK